MRTGRRYPQSSYFAHAIAGEEPRFNVKSNAKAVSALVDIKAEPSES
jgi:hypothetical protein